MAFKPSFFSSVSFCGFSISFFSIVSDTASESSELKLSLIQLKASFTTFSSSSLRSGISAIYLITFSFSSESGRSFTHLIKDSVISLSSSSLTFLMFAVNLSIIAPKELASLPSFIPPNFLFTK